MVSIMQREKAINFKVFDRYYWKSVTEISSLSHLFQVSVNFSKCENT